MNCMSRLLAVIPPSTFSVRRVSAGVGVHRVDHLAGLPAGRLQHRTGQVPLVMYDVSPTMTPRASLRQCGANSPENAGTM